MVFLTSIRRFKDGADLQKAVDETDTIDFCGGQIRVGIVKNGKKQETIEKASLCADISVVLVGVMYPSNVGACARLCHVFQVRSLILVSVFYFYFYFYFCSSYILGYVKKKKKNWLCGVCCAIISLEQRRLSV